MTMPLFYLKNVTLTTYLRHLSPLLYPFSCSFSFVYQVLIVCDTCVTFIVDTSYSGLRFSTISATRLQNQKTIRCSSQSAGCAQAVMTKSAAPSKGLKTKTPRPRRDFRRSEERRVGKERRHRR